MLDIDLLVYGDRLIRRPELEVPHPRLRERRFVLAPLAEVAPDLQLPPDGARVCDLLHAVRDSQDVVQSAWSRTTL